MKLPDGCELIAYVDDLALVAVYLGTGNRGNRRDDYFETNAECIGFSVERALWSYGVERGPKEEKRGCCSRLRGGLR